METEEVKIGIKRLNVGKTKKNRKFNLDIKTRKAKQKCKGYPDIIEIKFSLEQSRGYKSTNKVNN